jgi:AAA+ superfamily predicted ATPase
VTADPRLAAHLAALTVALEAYLARLSAVWTAATDVGRVMASVGARPEPDAPAREAVGRALAAARAADDGPLARIAGGLGLASGEEALVAAAWWAEADPHLAIALGCAHDDAGRRHATAALLRLVLEPFGVGVPPAVEDGDALVRCGVLEPGAGATGALALTPVARRLLAGGTPDPLADPGPPPRRLAAVRAALAGHLRGGGGPVVLRGPEGVGRRALAAAAARDAGMAPAGPDHPGRQLRLLARLGEAVPVVPAELLDGLDWDPRDPLVAWAPPGPAPAGHVVDVPAPSHAERARRWRRELPAAGLGRRAADRLARAMASRFAFTEGDIAAVVTRARAEAAWRGRELDAELVWDAARRHPQHALGRVAALVTPAFTLDDLVLEPDARRKIDELVAHVALQHVVLDDWGFRRRLPRGQGVAALFAGPPGTGKTMAAEAVAAALGQDLYRIDLSAVVSKYIGETEKNLATAFGEAERAGAVLLFDEADALFGKRTEVRDAHDRYANLEVNYLLQRVETFTGLVLLATNRGAAIDDAFLRRLRFSIRFELPDRALRRELWRRAFPREAALGRLSWEALAGAELAGGNIQSAALSAAYLAASDGGAIADAHVEHALRREYEKLGKAWPGLAPARSGAAA